MLLVRLGGEDEVFSNDRKFIEYKQMRGVCGGNVSNVESDWGILKRIDPLLGRSP